ncbi:MAG: AmmeMemoRadiSam system radical SAM enzyme [bacterium]
MKSISKRAFIRYCILGSGSCMLPPHIGVGRSRLDTDFSPVLSHQQDLGKWSTEAFFYSVLPDGIKCSKCPNECLLGEGDSGICRNRVVEKGKLYSIAYGNPCAVHIDPIEKKPFYHFIPSTRSFSIAAAGCTFRCLNCQNWEISQVSPRETQNYDLMPERVVEECEKARCESIAYTYSEPTSFYEYAFRTATLARKKKIKNVWKSNGYINAPALRQLCTVIDAANIDLKSFDQDIYRRLSSGKLAPILEALKIFHGEGVWLEITNLVIPSWTDSLEMIARMCDWLVQNGLSECPVHFTRFTPLYKLTHLPMTPVLTLEKAREIALKAGVRYAYVGNVPGHRAENTFCHRCGKMIIERKGFQIAVNHIVGGVCNFCKERIPGVWG